MLVIGKDAGPDAVRVKGKIKVCRIEYETKDRTNWKAVILAYSMEEAVLYLRKNVQAFDRYLSTGVVAEVDAIDAEVYNDFFVSRPAVETLPTQDDEDKQLQCPWCSKLFLNKMTLGSHIKRFHMENK